jgi:hypothetical protein
MTTIHEFWRNARARQRAKRIAEHRCASCGRGDERTAVGRVECITCTVARKDAYEARKVQA